MNILDPETAVWLRILSDVIAFIEYMAIVVAVAATVLTAICAAAATRPGIQALVITIMARNRKDPPEAPAPSAQPRIVPVSPPPQTAPQASHAPALKLQSGD